MRKWEDNGSEERNENILLTLTECNSDVYVMSCAQCVDEIHCFLCMYESQRLHLFLHISTPFIVSLSLSKLFTMLPKINTAVETHRYSRANVAATNSTPQTYSTLLQKMSPYTNTHGVSPSQ